MVVFVQFWRRLPLLFALGGSLAFSGSRPITVLLTYDQPFSQASFTALREQVTQLLKTAGMELDVKDRAEVNGHQEFRDVFLFKMRGACSMAKSTPLPIGALSDERGPLAMAYSADGTVLPFGEVECDRIRQSLERIVGPATATNYESVYGSALGMVMAHELYHMLARSSRHTRGGITKESLSARELLDGRLSLSEIARLAMRQDGRLDSLDLSKTPSKPGAGSSIIDLRWPQ